MGELQRIGEEIWVADGPIAIDLAVIPYPTRMTAVRLASGELWLASPVQRTYPQLGALAELGPVGHLLAPTPRHHWRLEPWHELFPDAALWSCRLGPATLGRRTLPARRLSDQPPAAWAGEIDQARYPGYGFEEITFCHRRSGTLLIEDLLQLHQPNPSALVNALVRVGGIGVNGGVPRDMRALTRRPLALGWANRILSWDFDRLVMAHGPVIDTGAKAWVARAFDWLLS